MLTGNSLACQFECQVHRIWLDTMKCGHWINMTYVATELSVKQLCNLKLQAR